MKKLTSIYIAISILLALSCLIYMVLAKTPLFNDGSVWMYEILNTQWFHSDIPHLRFSSFLFQVPTVVAINISHSDFSKEIAVHLFSFFYVFHPVLGLMTCYWILKKQNKIHLLIYPLLCFASVTLTTLLFGVGVSNESMTYFWPLIFLILKEDQDVFDTILIFFLITALVFSYELSIGLLALAIFCNYLMPKNNKRNRKINFLFLLSGFSSLLLIIRHVFLADISNRTQFTSSFIESPSMNLGLLSLIGLSFFIFITAPPIRRRSYKKLFPLLVFSLTIFFIYLFIVRDMAIFNFFMWNAYYSRTLVLPAGFCIAVMMIYLENPLKLEIIKFRIDQRVRYYLVIATFALMNFSTIFNYKIAEHWKKGLSEISNEIQANDSCYYMDRTKFDNKMNYYGVSEHYLPTLSVILNKSTKVKTMIFTNLKANDEEIFFNPCHSFKNGRLTAKGKMDWYFPILKQTNTLFNYDNILKSVKSY